jgi:hypothetical protein
MGEMKYDVELAMTGIGKLLVSEIAIDRHPMRSIACCLFIQEAGLHSVH